MAKIRPITLDFEGLPIEHRSTGRYPPVPVSFSLKMPEWRAPKFFAWGHKTGGNNCSLDDARNILGEAYHRISEANPILCHNAKFDLEVSQKHFGLAIPPWHLFHDTMFLLFLEDPHQRELGLKPSAARLLGMAPEEQDAVKNWLLDRKAKLEADYPEIKLYDQTIKDGEVKPGGIKPSNTGAFIAYAPGNIVKPYANGDVLRTEKLFDKLYAHVTVERGMRAAYDRERQLMPILLRNEQEGVRTDQAALQRDQPIFEAAQARADDYLRKALKAPGLDLDKDIDVAKALEAADMITEWTLTPTGRNSTSKKNMKLSHFRDKKVAAAYSYRQKCATILETFIRPWQRYGGATGWMHCTWNTVRQSKGANDTGGTRTGRPSTDSPNFLNMPRNIKGDSDVEGFMMPTHIKGLPLMPSVRSYILPDTAKHVVVKRDFDGQELRVLAHFEDGGLLDGFRANPHLDVHEFVRLKILELTGMDIGRPYTKQLNFGYIYGMGLGSLAERLQVEVEKVKALRAAQMAALPGLKDLDRSLKKIGKEGGFITNWGGRQYYTEPPIQREGYFQTFEYKLLNYLVQSSAADITKEALIRYDAVKKDGRLMLTVYDEFDLSVPKAAAKREAMILRDCMLSIELDVPLTSGCEIGPNVGSLTEIKEPKFDFKRWAV
jgi:DNA polymerase I-like protein with 3'-5' exonuclease and polymerase domains